MLTGKIIGLFNQLDNLVKIAIGASGGVVIGWKMLKAQIGEADDDTGMQTKKHWMGIVRVVIYTIMGEVANEIFALLIK